MSRKEKSPIRSLSEGEHARASNSPARPEARCLAGFFRLAKRKFQAGKKRQKS
jgi:hypothetical protein